MRTLCPNLERDDALDTVLEIPMPDQISSSDDKNGSSDDLEGRKKKKPTTWMMMKSHFQAGDQTPRAIPSSLFGGQHTELQLLVGASAAPLIPVPIPAGHSLDLHIKDHPLESSMAKYIVHQYIAAVGGDSALNSIDSFYAMGEVKMVASEFCCEDGKKNNSSKSKRARNRGGAGEGCGVGSSHAGGFILWQKRPDVWSLELVVSGSKISAGSDGKVAWRQTPWNHSHASKGPPRPLRRSLQGLDPRSTATLFSNAVCMGEKMVDEENCFLLKLEAEPSILEARSTDNVEILRHTVWGCFNQKSGLLVQLEDTHLLRIKASEAESIYWETTMESLIEDYRPIDGVNIAHSGRTSVSIFRFGDSASAHTRTRMEETWMIEEVDFNIRGLSMECFLPPADLKKEHEVQNIITTVKNRRLPSIPQMPMRIGSSKVVAVNMDDADAVDKD